MHTIPMSKIILAKDLCFSMISIKGKSNRGASICMNLTEID